jgi:hypothetical protein
MPGHPKLACRIKICTDDCHPQSHSKTSFATTLKRLQKNRFQRGMLMMHNWAAQV